MPHGLRSRKHHDCLVERVSWHHIAPCIRIKHRRSHGPNYCSWTAIPVRKVTNPVTEDLARLLNRIILRTSEDCPLLARATVEHGIGSDRRGFHIARRHNLVGLRASVERITDAIVKPGDGLEFSFSLNLKTSVVVRHGVTRLHRAAPNQYTVPISVRAYGKLYVVERLAP